MNTVLNGYGFMGGAYNSTYYDNDRNYYNNDPFRTKNRK